jgi:hypothetical protein
VTPAAILSELRRRDVRVHVDGGKIVYEAPKGALTRDLVNDIVANKEALLEILRDGSQEEPRSSNGALEKRVQLFSAFLEQWRRSGGHGFPVLTIRSVGTVKRGQCFSCGEFFEEPGLRCDLCRRAALIVINAARSVEARPTGKDGHVAVPLAANEQFRWWEAGDDGERMRRFERARAAAGLAASGGTPDA